MKTIFSNKHPSHKTHTKFLKQIWIEKPVKDISFRLIPTIILTNFHKT